jgi:hypothetical protein
VGTKSGEALEAVPQGFLPVVPRGFLPVIAGHGARYCNEAVSISFVGGEIAPGACTAFLEKQSFPLVTFLAVTFLDNQSFPMVTSLRS